MTINEINNAAAANINKAIEIGKEKKQNGVEKSVLDMRLNTFSDLLDWVNRGRADRKKDKMTHLLKRSERMIEAFARL